MELDISRMRFPDGFFESMAERTTVAFAAMKELEGGSIANPDEKRMVGHYWLRTPELAPTAEIRESIINCVDEIKAFASKVRSGAIKSCTGKKFTDLLLVGIGGSALGPQLVYDALSRTGDPIAVHFCDNTDPDGITRIVQNLGDRLGQTLVLVVSKSGGTPETRNGAVEISHAFSRRKLESTKNFVAITCPGSKLDSQAINERWLARFPMWDWVGGRTSIFSAVGLVPAALHGVDVEAFIAGARKMDELTRGQTVTQNPAMLLALMWHFSGDGRGKKDMVILPYKDRLQLMSRYLQQLVMESLGKERDLKGNTVNQGIAVYGNKGSTDQHAYVQQLREGVNNFFATFIQVLVDYTEPQKELEIEPGVTSGDYLCGFLQGTRTALFDNQRDSVTITFRELNTETVGALIALYDRAVGYYASLVGINAYHQPGVEAGKKAAADVLSIQQRAVAELKKQGNKQALTADQIAAAIGAPDEAETVYKVLQHLAANHNRGVVQGGSGGPATITFRANYDTV